MREGDADTPDRPPASRGEAACAAFAQASIPRIEACLNMTSAVCSGDCDTTEQLCRWWPPVARERVWAMKLPAGGLSQKKYRSSQTMGFGSRRLCNKWDSSSSGAGPIQRLGGGDSLEEAAPGATKRSRVFEYRGYNTGLCLRGEKDTKVVKIMGSRHTDERRGGDGYVEVLGQISRKTPSP